MLYVSVQVVYFLSFYEYLMTLRQHIFSKYLHNQKVYEIIWHSNRLYVKVFSIFLLVLWLFVSAVYFLNIFTGRAWLWTMSSIIILWAYIKCVLSLFDDYLDALLITDLWLTHIRWDNPFKHRVDTIERSSIETVSDYQDNVLDTIFKKGHLKISLIEDDYYFRDVQDPAESSTMILNYKEMIISKQMANRQQVAQPSNDKYKLLVEALGEVVTDYVEKKDRRNLY